MAAEVGAFMAGPNLMLIPGSGGQVLVGSATVDLFGMKSHANYAGSQMQSKTFAVSTTDATVTVIANIDVPADYAIAADVLVVGKKASAADGCGARALAVISNNGGTTALVGTQLYQVAETGAGTDVTVTANNTTDVLEVKVTGVAAENWAWVAYVNWISVKTSA